MGNDLTVLLDEQEDRHLQPAADTALVLATISSLGREVEDFMEASLEERASVVHQLEALRVIELAAKSRRQVIEQGIVRAAERLEARELRIADGAVRIEPPNVGYDTEDMSLRNALVVLIPLGDVTRAEVDEAIPEIITVKPDHRKLNGLLKRGGRVQEAIETHRTRRAADMRYAKVKINRKKVGR